MSSKPNDFSSKHIEVSCQAFVKLQLHLAKYPHCAINGLLLAKQVKKEDKTLEIVDVIPLFHQCLQLTPMLEIALMHIEAHCNKYDLWIAGYYEAAESLRAPLEPSTFSERIADKLFDNCTGSKLVIIDNKKVTKLESLHFYDRSSGKWKPAQEKVAYENGAYKTLQGLLDKCIQRDLVDFDNHLCDISLHWLNHPINQLISME